MTLSQIILMQHYLTVFLLVGAAVVWYKLKQSVDVSQLRGSRLYSMALLLALPFVVSIMSFIPDQIETMLKQLLLLLIFILLAVAGIRSYKGAFKERKDALRELYEDAGKHPIRLEFARHVVEPEMSKVFDLKEKLLFERKSLQIKERFFAQKDEKVQKKLERLEALQKQIRDEEAKLATKREETKDKERAAARKEEIVVKKQLDLDATKQKWAQREKGYDEKLLALGKKEEKLNEEYAALKTELKKKFEVLATEQREHLKKQTVKREGEFKEWEADLRVYKEDLNQKKEELQKKKHELDEIKDELIDIKDERAHLQRERERYQLEKQDAVLSRKKLKREQEDFEHDREEVLALQESVKRREAKLKRREEDLHKDIERLKEREAEAKKALEETKQRGRENKGIKPSEPHSIVWSTDPKKDKKITKASMKGGALAEIKSHFNHVLDLFGL